jgi:Ca-activated chloride channel family protein
MRFAASELLWTLLAVPAVLLLALWLARWRRAALRRLGEPATLLRGSTGPGSERRAARLALVLIAACGVSLALARPQWGTRLQEVRRKGVDLVIAIDVSRSMLAQDVSPSRLALARAALSSLIERLPDDRVGLVAFAGEAQLLCPLTLDHGAARVFLEALDPGIVAAPGSDLAAAIRKGAGLFDASERQYKVLVLITDGEDHDTSPLDAAKAAAEQGVVIFPLGVGTTRGEPIPVRDAEGQVKDYVRDEQGQVVTSRLDVPTLEGIAAAAHGEFHIATAGQPEIGQIAEAIARLDRKDLSSRLTESQEDRYQWPLAVAIVTITAEALAGERRWIRRPRRRG